MKRAGSGSGSALTDHVTTGPCSSVHNTTTSTTTSSRLTGTGPGWRERRRRRRRRRGIGAVQSQNTAEDRTAAHPQQNAQPRTRLPRTQLRVHAQSRTHSRVRCSKTFPPLLMWKLSKLCSVYVLLLSWQP